MYLVSDSAEQAVSIAFDHLDSQSQRLELLTLPGHVVAFARFLLLHTPSIQVIAEISGEVAGREATFFLGCSCFFASFASLLFLGIRSRQRSGARCSVLRLHTFSKRLQEHTTARWTSG